MSVPAQMICSWCRKVLYMTRTPHGAPSHGICAECAARMMAGLTPARELPSGRVA